MIAVPLGGVKAAVLECTHKGVRVVQVFTAGFAEADAAGAALQQRLVDICRGAGMRLLGPNARGVLNPKTRLACEDGDRQRAALPPTPARWRATSRSAS